MPAMVVALLAILALPAWAVAAAPGSDDVGGAARHGSAGDATAPHGTEARLVDEAAKIVIDAASGRRIFTIPEWRAWAEEHLAQVVTEPLAIGPAQVGVDDFRRFGVAVPAPDGERVLFSATTYAMLTTLSLVGVLDLDTGTITMRPEPRMGDLETVTWSAEGRYVAYTLGTARSGGEFLYVDSWQDGGRGGGHAGASASTSGGGREAGQAGEPDARASANLTRQAMYRAWLAADLPLVARVGPDRYRPLFRDLAWFADGRLSFVVNAPGAWQADPGDEGTKEYPGMRWSMAADGSDLRPEGPVSDATAAD